MVKSVRVVKTQAPAALAYAVFFATSAFCYGANEKAFPPPNILQTGDLIWPKPPNAIVPYNSRPGEANHSDAVMWQKQKDQYLEELRHKPNPSEEDKERYALLRDMDYKKFVARYMDDLAPGETMPYGTGFVSVGHVAIIQVLNGNPMVVEAMMKYGVRRIPYNQWTSERAGELFWLGRLKDVSAEKRAAIASVAAKYIGRPYQFFNFNLKDDSGFYCSKLAWLSIFTAANFAPDDNPNPNRVLWFSPKQLMHSGHLQLIVNPGSYGTAHPPL